MGDDSDRSSLPIEALRRFLLHPAEAFLQQRLDLRLDAIEQRDPDVEPLAAPGPGLERSLLQAAMFEALQRGDDDGAIHAALRARGMLASGAPGRRTLSDLRRQLAPYADALSRWHGGAAPESLQVEADIGGVRLHGRIADVYPAGIARLRFGKPNGPGMIRDGLDWLLARAAGVDTTLAQFHEDGRGLGPHERNPLSPDTARAALRRLLELREQGLCEPLPFGPYSGWEFFIAGDHARGVKAAAAKWRGSARSYAEGEDEALRLALRGRDPFADEATLLRFADVSMAVFSAVISGSVYVGVDANTLKGLASADDAEDAA